MRSRIVGYADVPPDQLLAHEDNFRRHPGVQLDALRGSLRTLGWVKPILVSRASGKVVDGHARVEVALQHNYPTVPVAYLDLSPEEEKAALAALDQIGEMAYRDDTALRALLDSFEVQDAEFNAFLQGLDKPFVPPPESQEPPVGGGAPLTTCPKCGHTFQGQESKT